MIPKTLLDIVKNNYLKAEVPYPENREILEEGNCPFLPPMDLTTPLKIHKSFNKFFFQYKKYREPVLNSAVMYYMLNNISLREAREGLSKLKENLQNPNSELTVMTS